MLIGISDSRSEGFFETTLCAGGGQRSSHEQHNVG